MAEVGRVTFFILEVPDYESAMLIYFYTYIYSVRVHSWVNPLFLETIGPIEPQIWWKMCLQTSFSCLSQTVWGFLRKKLETVFGTTFTKKKKKKGYIHFCRLTPRSLKNGDAPKNNFSLKFWKILFFLKKLLDKKYSKCRCLQKGLY